ncbi:alpha/beta hydrolase family esterase [Sphingomonas solaris]|uniref:PHB depolymerase family esterase n=1 Tax=Alterirhizorhabdus solaris TaxID=2529389 RepID=A0A558RD42_9SPHN|nr:PHB depolymerase family esterase [Sphingomonas solaris]TVV77231.1 PHB depolymerase family esterase [Sphingomonas solaris]
MQNPFRTIARAQKLVRTGRPFAAATALHTLLAPPPAKPRAAPKRRTKPPLPARPAPGTFVQGRHTSAQGEMIYKLYTPVGSNRRKLPLVVMLHGCGQSADDFAAGTAMNRLADEYGFLVLYPEQSRQANFGRCWNWHRPGDQVRSGEPKTIAALTRDIAVICHAHPGRIYIAGISAGGAAAAITAAAYPELFVAVGVHSGVARGDITTLTGALGAMRSGNGGGTGKARTPPPTIVFHGDRDKIVHPANAAGFLGHLRRSTTKPLVSRVSHGRSAGGRDYTCTVHAHADDAVVLEDWVIHGSGHAWSGGSVAGSHTDPAGPDASREMIRFFLARRRPTAPKHAA